MVSKAKKCKVWQMQWTRERIKTGEKEKGPYVLPESDNDTEMLQKAHGHHRALWRYLLFCQIRNRNHSPVSV